MVGSYFCQSIKEELEVYVALINGGSIKGGTSYPSNSMSYAELKKELPFPTKMVVIEMRRDDLQHAVHYSRNHIPEGAAPNEDGEYERRGFLQVDLDFDLDPHAGDHDDIIKVALPWNLLSG
jgi:2',3'-cyclic-nucleotide 2'-phosphodiesterase (5'-nucleotidase family)